MATKGTATVTLPADEEILIAREFDAPPELVFKAWTTPELVERWWGGTHGAMALVEIDLRVGGRWRYVMDTGDGPDVSFNGEFQEIVPAERIVTTEVYEQAPPGAGPAMNYVSFLPADGGRTRLELLVRVDGKETRDAIIDTGMEVGMQDHYDVLDELVASLR